MAEYSRLELFNGIIKSGLIPIFYHHDLNTAQRIMEACVLGGAGVIEFTNRGDRAGQIFSKLLEHRQRNHLDVMLGVGSIVDAPTAAFYINNGADFIVGPILNREIADLCNRRKVAYIPGCGTVNEISAAEATGAELVKIFPGDVLGPDFVRAVHGPLPWTNMVVTGGVIPEKDNILAWFKAGVSAVGLGSKLIRKDWVSAGQFHQITESISLILKWIEQSEFRRHG